MRGLRLGLGFGRTQAGGVVPVLSDFGAGSIDDLELDPPAIFIEHNTSGTLTGDFHSSATPPAKEAGDIGFFTTSLSGDAVTDISTAVNTFLDLHPGETGYLHFRLTNGAGDSSVITTQVITVPVPSQNLLAWSEDFSNWTFQNGAIISTGVADPLSGTDARLFGDNSAGGTGVVLMRWDVTVPAAGTYTFSIYAKAGGLTDFALDTSLFDSSGNDTTTFFLGTGTAENRANHDPIITDLGGGWFRCSVIFATTTDLAGRVTVYMEEGGSLTVARDGTSNMNLFGAQLNEGSAPYAYTKTTGTPVP